MVPLSPSLPAVLNSRSSLPRSSRPAAVCLPSNLALGCFALRCRPLGSFALHRLLLRRLHSLHGMRREAHRRWRRVCWSIEVELGTAMMRLGLATGGFLAAVTSFPLTASFSTAAFLASASLAAASSRSSTAFCSLLCLLLPPLPSSPWRPGHRSMLEQP